ncbi:hypothetical protein Pelo_18031 [Pelomyxa schiedti]|nr:hypothetical protein Pelo_18031 [Pelomyxa schiedti]
MKRAPVSMIEAVALARSQFVAFACASIGRCGCHSPARFFLVENPALFEEFGRQWVVSCVRKVGSTLSLHATCTPVCDIWMRPGSTDYYFKAATRVDVFIGLSATLGVVWCKCWTASEAPPRMADWLAVNRPLGGGDGGDGDGNGMGMFLVTSKSSEALGCVLDCAKRTVELLIYPQEGAKCLESGFWVANRKWVGVAVTSSRETLTNLVVWKMEKGVASPFERAGVCLKLTVPIEVCGATFSPFNPCGDELVVIGASFAADGSGCLYFVDLEKSVLAGTEAVITHTLALPEPAFDLLWAAPDTILTMHFCNHGIGVYNTKTREQRVFPHLVYQKLECIPPAHFSLTPRDPQRSTVREVYSTSDTRHRLCKIHREGTDPDWNVDSTDPGIYASLVPKSPSSASGEETAQMQLSVHDAITGKSIAIVTIMVRITLHSTGIQFFQLGSRVGDGSCITITAS